jgi:hypothetical protein
MNTGFKTSHTINNTITSTNKGTKDATVRKCYQSINTPVNYLCMRLY